MVKMEFLSLKKKKDTDQSKTEKISVAIDHM